MVDDANVTLPWLNLALDDVDNSALATVARDLGDRLDCRQLIEKAAAEVQYSQPGHSSPVYLQHLILPVLHLTCHLFTTTSLWLHASHLGRHTGIVILHQLFLQESADHHDMEFKFWPLTDAHNN